MIFNWVTEIRLWICHSAQGIKIFQAQLFRKECSKWSNNSFRWLGVHWKFCQLCLLLCLHLHFKGPTVCCQKLVMWHLNLHHFTTKFNAAFLLINTSLPYVCIDVYCPVGCLQEHMTDSRSSDSSCKKDRVVIKWVTVNQLNLTALKFSVLQIET